MWKKLFGFVLELLFPSRCPWCGEVIGFAEGCESCISLEELRLLDTPLDNAAEGRDMKYLQRAWACFSYKSPVRDAILRVKFEEDRTPVHELGKLMAAKFGACNLDKQFDIVIPVPVSHRTMRRRGYNQSVLLARQLAEKYALPLEESVLLKTKETKRQIDIGRDERRANVKGAYRLAANSFVSGKRILLVDDVITTGSTLDECAKTLQEAGAAECCALCLASAEKPEK